MKTRISKLISVDEVKSSLMRDEPLSDRKTGETTGRVLEAIGQAMQTPEKPVKLWTRHNIDHVMQITHGLLSMWGLKHFTVKQIDRHTMSITYDIYYDLKDIVRYVESNQ